MWIRSQDLYTLIKCECLSVRKYGSEEYCVIGNECVVLGEYSTLDKALKVLDKIQKFTYLNAYFNTKENSFTYQMPQDDEVVL